MLSINLFSKRRGDTIVEVLLAMALVSTILIGAYNLSNKATQTNQTAYERSRAADLVKEQSEYLRAARIENENAWGDLTDSAVYRVELYYDCRNEQVSVNPGNSVNGAFHITGDSSGLTVVAGAKRTDTFYYSWITRKTDGNGYYDFYVYTCWEGIGATPQQVAGTIVRLEAD